MISRIIKFLRSLLQSPAKREERMEKAIEKIEKRLGVRREVVNLAGTPARVSFEKTFEPVKPPPGVVPEEYLNKDGTMAMDDGFLGQMEWANYGRFKEGLGFLGYPYLAELSQRPEYRNMVEIIAQEMTRKWLKITSTTTDDPTKTEKIKKIEDELKRLRVQDVFRDAIEKDGYFGRAHIYLDTGDGENPEELKTSLGSGASELTKAKVTMRHPLKRLQLVEPVWTYPNAYNSNNPLAQDYFKPQNWFVQGKLVHHTRLLTFVGRKVPDLLKPAYSFGGLSLTQIAKPYVDNWLRTRQSVSDLIHSFSIMVLVTQMGDILNEGGAADLLNRIELFNRTRDNRGLMVLDKDTEDFKNVSANIAGLDHLQAQSQEQMSSVSKVPLIKLLGITPTGLNTSSDGEFEAFNATVEAKQEAEMSAPFQVILNLVQLSLFNYIDPDIGFKWEPLFVLDEAELANTRKVEAETDVALINAGVISPQEARERVASQEDSAYSSIDVDAEITPPGMEQGVEPGQENFGEQDTGGFGEDPDATGEQHAKGAAPVESKPLVSKPIPSEPPKIDKV